MSDRPTTHDDYLARLRDDQRAALAHLRAVVRAVVPEAREVIRYGLPAFQSDGKVVVGYGAAARHCALYCFSGTTVDAHPELLAGRDTSKGTVRFTPADPLPDDLVRTLVRARLAENGS